MEIILINLLGALLGTTAVLAFYGTWWKLRKINRYAMMLGIAVIVIAKVASATLLVNSIVLMPVTVLLIFCSSFYFVSDIARKILCALLLTAILFIVELFTVMIFVNVLGVAMEQVYASSILFFVGVVISRLLVLLIAYVIRVAMKGYQKKSGNQFNWIMLLMPLQSIIICFIVYFHSINIDEIQAFPLGMISILLSLTLIFVTMFIVKNLQKAVAYKHDYELALVKLNTQIEHYKKLYQAQYEVRAIRHDLNNELIAISGMLDDSRIQEALEYISEMTSSISKTSAITDTKNPALDAVINAKIDKAEKSGAHIISKITIGSDSLIDGFDLAGIVAAALDNAIEGILRSCGVEKEIYLSIDDKSGFISIVVENYTSGLVHTDFQTTKSDKSNHGFGIAQMRAIAEKYGGIVEPKYDQKLKKFSLNVLLKNS